jgi:undecaprenyl phosphate-alpha-L-ara4N flippase subunit ArnE
MTVASYCVILTAVLFEALGQISFKRAASRSPANGAAPIRDFWIAVFRNGWTYVGVAAYGIELLLWIAALRLAPLAVAFPLLSLSYCVVAIASRLFLHETISRRNAIGIALITVGVVCVAGAAA